jgi:hypothetical protein
MIDNFKYKPCVHNRSVVMNRKNLTAAVLAGLAGVVGIVGSAQAVNVNPDGLGQVLLYPYYTTNGGNQTLLSVVNTTGDAKAVKVRFLEGQNSREVLDFNLYMSAYDVWTAALYDDDGAPTMVTSDTTCTVPYIYGDFDGKQAFLPWAMDDEDPDGFADVTVRGTEGHFEMIEMGTMINQQIDDPDEDADPGDTIDEFGSAAAATHSDGTPANCDQLVEAWTRVPSDPDENGYWITDNLADMTAPSGGLFGGAAIVNVQGGTMYSYDAKAINGFADSVEADNYENADDMHQEPGTILPSLDSGGEFLATVFADDGTLIVAELDRGVDALSYLFMHDQIMNEYTTESVVNGATEWVVTFPTKQFYVHQAFLDDYAAHRTDASGSTVDPYYRITPITDAGTVDEAGGDFIPNDPFTSSWTWVAETYEEDGETIKTEAFVDYPCEVVTIDTLVDREEEGRADAPAGPDQPPVVSPKPPGIDPDGLPSFTTCFETQVIVFGEIGEDGPTPKEGGSPILGSANVTTIDAGAHGFEAGWMSLGLSTYNQDKDQDGSFEAYARVPLGLDGDALAGLPVTGFAVQRFENGFLGEGSSTLANYGGIFGHKGTRLVSDGTGADYPACEPGFGGSSDNNPGDCD